MEGRGTRTHLFTMFKWLLNVLLAVIYVPTMLMVVAYIKLLAWHKNGDIDG